MLTPISKQGGDNSGGPLSFSPDGNRLAACLDEKIILWDVQTGQELASRKHNPATLCCLALSPDGRHLAAGGQKYVNLYNLNSSTPHPQGLHWPAGNFRAVLFLPDGLTLAAARGRDIGLWDLESARRRLTLHGHRETVRCLAVSPDGQTLASGSDDWSVKLWNVATGHERASLNWRIGAVTAVAFAPDGMTAAAGSERGSIFIWDVDTLDH
jgi:WD40 repeat protein